jgi:hypothetical protein
LGSAAALVLAGPINIDPFAASAALIVTMVAFLVEFVIVVAVELGAL